MKILTLNTWQERGPWRDRWELILKGLAEHDPDVVGFQEVFNMDWAEEVRRRSGYPYLAVSGQHSGLIFLSKYKPAEQECIIYKAKSPTEDYLRYAFYVSVDTGEEKLALFNTHLSWKVDEGQVRMQQTLELHEFVGRKAARGQPVVLMGDLNAAANTPGVVFLREMHKWIDTFLTKNPGELGLTWDYRNSYAEAEREKMAERRIDYIFIRERVGPLARIRSSKVVFDQPSSAGVWPSDHFGVLTEFTS
ncbi:MAG TPA: endonuclease/exonuclease/phosphatase family protein [Candidatus Omnitrophota bacterium]|nr:endonuclease/exonuclease/phosphatase family protein [Candidatus Omnitrophota bacterium]HPS37455.1 endonuclease/exonuclease/phosphatase family protein [Candidatus Omnitrophota bacterium]